MFDLLVYKQILLALYIHETTIALQHWCRLKVTIRSQVYKYQLATSQLY